MRRPIIAGNWKMNTTVEEAQALAKALKIGLEATPGVEAVLCPPFISLAALRDILGNSTVALGAQNMHFQEKGAFTGEVSPLMLRTLCRYVILGHSERRQYFGETDDLINKKVKAALAHGLTPILCVGESLQQNEAGLAAQVIAAQVKAGLEGVDAVGGLVIAYEPVWAIGTGKAATSRQANDTIGLIRKTVAGICGQNVAQGMRIQYGGSVTAANVAEFLSQPEIDGALVGGASLKADEFLSIVQQTAQIKKPT